MNAQNKNLQDCIEADEDARLPALEARIDREWRQFRPQYYRKLRADRKLAENIRSTAIWCIQTLNQFEERGLNPDQGREAIQELIIPDGSVE